MSPTRNIAVAKPFSESVTINDVHTTGGDYVRLTNEAKVLLSRLAVPQGSVLRLEPVGEDRVGFVVGAPSTDDKVVLAGGTELLRISPSLQESLDDALMEVQASADGSLRLLIRRRSRVASSGGDPSGG